MSSIWGDDLNLPLLTLAAAGDDFTSAHLVLPILSLSAEAIPGIDAGDLILPRLTADGAASGENAGSGESTFPLLELEAALQGENRNDLPGLTLSAVAVAGQDGSLLGIMPVLVASAEALQAGEAAGSSVLPRLTLSASGGATGVISFAGGLPLLRAIGSLSSANVSVGDGLLPILTISGQASIPSEGTAALDLPALFASGRAIQIDAASFRTFVLNLRTRAPTEYSGLSFDSLAVFNGKVIAAGPGGLYELGEPSLDAGTRISASASTAPTDLGLTILKRVPRAYINARMDGDIRFVTITSEDGTRKYHVPHRGFARAYQSRVVMGRGPLTRFWQFGIDNYNGSDFEVSSLVLKAHYSPRRVV